VPVDVTPQTGAKTGKVVEFFLACGLSQNAGMPAFSSCLALCVV
jgi:hypothetical protein